MHEKQWLLRCLNHAGLRHSSGNLRVQHKWRIIPSPCTRLQEAAWFTCGFAEIEAAPLLLPKSSLHHVGMPVQLCAKWSVEICRIHSAQSRWVAIAWTFSLMFQWHSLNTSVVGLKNWKGKVGLPRLVQRKPSKMCFQNILPFSMFFADSSFEFYPLLDLMCVRGWMPYSACERHSYWQAAQSCSQTVATIDAWAFHVFNMWSSRCRK